MVAMRDISGPSQVGGGEKDRQAERGRESGREEEGKRGEKGRGQWEWRGSILNIEEGAEIAGMDFLRACL